MDWIRAILLMERLQTLPIILLRGPFKQTGVRHLHFSHIHPSFSSFPTNPYIANMADTLAAEKESATQQSDNVTFFRKRPAKKNLRKRKASPTRNDSDDDDDDDIVVSEVVTKERKTALTPFVQSTRRKNKRRSAADADGEQDDLDDDDNTIGVQYTADRSAQSKQSDATRYATEWELETEALLKRSKKPTPNPKVTNSKMQVGPQRAPANIRVTARFDYQPDVCKDYKETGFCGYGDSCIFLHDRGDYKTGWQLEKEWEEAQRNKTQFGASDPNKYAVESDSDDEELPFACLICRQEFTDPVVTRCNHYFCEKCAMEHHKKSPKCFACGAATSGIFNTAKNMLQRLKQKKERLKAANGDEEQDETNNDLSIEGLEEKKEDTSSESSDSDSD